MTLADNPGDRLPLTYGKAGNKKKSMVNHNEILMERSPDRWKTTNRDQFRKFTNSPTKEDPMNIKNADQLAPEAANEMQQEVQMDSIGAHMIMASPDLEEEYVA